MKKNIIDEMVQPFHLIYFSILLENIHLALNTSLGWKNKLSISLSTFSISPFPRRNGSTISLDLFFNSAGEYPSLLEYLPKIKKTSYQYLSLSFSFSPCKCGNGSTISLDLFFNSAGEYPSRLEYHLRMKKEVINISLYLFHFSL